MSLLTRPSAADKRQAALFLQPGELALEQGRDLSLATVRVNQLQALLPPLLGDEASVRLWRQFETDYQQRLLPGDRAPQFVVQEIESLLAGIIGAASAHSAIVQLEESGQLGFQDLAGMVSDASRVNEFNRELLQTTVETITQGISVVDADMRLVAWNQRYQELFNFPERFLYVGCPIRKVYELNAARGLLGGAGDEEQQIEKRLALLREGSPYRLQRELPTGITLDLRGTPMANGGFVTTYTDITDYVEVMTQLDEARLELEEQH